MRVKSNLDAIIYDRIISALIMGEYQMGQVISLDDLSAKYEVSRTPVTQAVRLLTNDGILEMQKNGRVKVPEMTEEDLKKICEVRLLLEKFAVKRTFLVMDQLGKEYFDNLEQLADKGIKAIRNQDVLGFNKLDMEFHKGLISGVHNVYLEEEYKEIQGKFLVANYLLYPINGRDFIGAAEDHVKIVDAIKEKNINACLGLIRKHVYPFRIEYSDDMLVEKFHYIK